MNYWLVKQEPSEFSWDDFVNDGVTDWDGVRNYQARNNLQQMQPDDRVLFYHSVKEKRVVGLARVTKSAFPDPTADSDKWVAVELKPVGPVPEPVTLAQIKEEPALKEIALVKQTRLSVMPLDEPAFYRILEMGGFDPEKI